MLAIAWAAVILGAPAVRAARPGTGLAIAAAVPYAIGARICHQRPERSFHTHGVPWPVCGRCAGLYLAGAAGLVGAALVRRRCAAPSRALLAAAAAPTLLTWALEVAGVWNPGTPLRALAAVPLGAVIGWALYYASGTPDV
ncbi:hypothetical protein TBR22_A33800 [Luteitalea sp. TBR-22]|nr:hypothetical protein TBR22_A33800 [Luteitalea sp. TBR-22]